MIFFSQDIEPIRNDNKDTLSVQMPVFDKVTLNTKNKGDLEWTTMNKTSLEGYFHYTMN